MHLAVWLCRAAHRACAKCKKAKIRCIPVEGEQQCRKCKAMNVECVIEKRKPPRNPNKREYFLAQIREKDAIIETLLKELYNPYSATPLSVQSFRDATPRADAANAQVVEWLDRLKDGARPIQPNRFFVPGASGPALSRRARASGDEDEDGEEAEEVGDGDSSRGTQRAEEQSPLEEAYPIAQIAGLSIDQAEGANDRASEVSGSATAFEEHEGVGVPNPQYFKPGPAADLGLRAKLIAEHSKAELLTHGLVTEADVEQLFELYHKQLNSFVPLLDPYIHTPRETFSRCPCLFTVVCAIAARYLPEKAHIYPVAMHFAKNEAANALMHGWKSVELSQAFILLAMYSPPARRWEEERSYLYAGLAMRIAVDLNLHVTPILKVKAEAEDREMLNRMRLWMICFETDYTMATHYGKPASLKENHIIRSSDTFYERSPYNLVADIHLSAYNKLLRLMAAFHGEVYSDPDSRTGLRKTLDFATVTLKYDKEMDVLVDVWLKKFGEFKRFENNPVYEFRQLLLPYVVNYSRLVMWSFGFQKAFEMGMQSKDQFFFNKCYDAAKGVVKAFVDILAPSGYMRYAPNGWFNFCAFASAFLMKLLRPDFASFLTKDDEREISTLILRLVKAMSSPEVSIDDRHTPKLWARFLEDLLAKQHLGGAPQPEAPAEVKSAGYPPSSSMHVFQVQQHAAAAAGVVMDPTSPSTALQHTLTFEDLPGMTTGLDFVPATAFVPGSFAPAADLGGMMMVDDDSTISPMAALSNPAFWNNMMMPGFFWPDSPPSGSELSAEVEYQAQVQQPPRPGASWYQ